jgi:cobalt-zinc-cadmium efflux system membrane fusion protein
MIRPIRKTLVWSLVALLGIGAGVAFYAKDRWFPTVQQWTLATFASSPSDSSCPLDHDHSTHASHAGHEHASTIRGQDTHKHDHAGHDHGDDDHAGHDHSKSDTAHDHDHDHDHEEDADHQHEGTSASKTDPHHAHDEPSHAEIAMHLSSAARENVGVKLAQVKLSTFERTISVPAMVVKRPGRSHIDVAAPFTGRVTRVWPTEGETVTPGQPLFELRLTHEDLVVAQSDFLKTAEELDVVKREVNRLQQVTSQGAIAGKTWLERKYEQDKLEGVLRSQRQQLLLHGLTASQIDGILANHTLVSSITVSVPSPAEETSGQTPERLLQVEQLKVQPGQHVAEGQTLSTLGDYAELHIEGKAFEDDAPALIRAADHKWTATAMIAASGQKPTKVTGLKILYLANRIDPETRAFLFYVRLPNRLVRDRTDGGHRFSDWQFRPGQRVQLLVPVEQWTDRIVLPVDAVVQDGAESYVFEEHDGHFDRRTVRVEYRDQHSVVLANNGALKPGVAVAVAGAYQLHLAMKNKAGGAVAPHAGHRH